MPPKKRKLPDSEEHPKEHAAAKQERKRRKKETKPIGPPTSSKLPKAKAVKTMRAPSRKHPEKDMKAYPKRKELQRGPGRTKMKPGYRMKEDSPWAYENMNPKGFLRAAEEENRAYTHAEHLHAKERHLSNYPETLRSVIGPASFRAAVLSQYIPPSRLESMKQEAGKETGRGINSAETAANIQAASVPYKQTKKELKAFRQSIAGGGRVAHKYLHPGTGTIQKSLGLGEYVGEEQAKPIREIERSLSNKAAEQLHHVQQIAESFPTLTRTEQKGRTLLRTQRKAYERQFPLHPIDYTTPEKTITEHRSGAEIENLQTEEDHLLNPFYDRYAPGPILSSTVVPVRQRENPGAPWKEIGHVSIRHVRPTTVPPPPVPTSLPSSSFPGAPPFLSPPRRSRLYPRDRGPTPF